MFSILYAVTPYKLKLNKFPNLSTEETPSAALVVPTAFVVLGLVVLLMGSAYVIRLRKKTQKHLEVADFDFHPSLTQSTSEPRPGRVSFSLSNIGSQLEASASWMTNSVRNLRDRVVGGPHRHGYDKIETQEVTLAETNTDGHLYQSLDN